MNPIPEDDRRASLLREIKRLRSLRLTCACCGKVRIVKRGYPIKIWMHIEKTDTLPSKWDLPCETCREIHPHFIDWPET